MYVYIYMCVCACVCVCVKYSNISMLVATVLSTISRLSCDKCELKNEIELTDHLCVKN